MPIPPFARNFTNGLLEMCIIPIHYESVQKGTALLTWKGDACTHHVENKIYDFNIGIMISNELQFTCFVEDTGRVILYSPTQEGFLTVLSTELSSWYISQNMVHHCEENTRKLFETSGRM